MSKAEERAFEYQMATHPNVIGGMGILSEEEFKKFNTNPHFKAGYEQAEKDLSNPWIPCSKQMPKEDKYEDNNLQGHHEWTASKQVLAWDSMYGPRVDHTHNGKWASEIRYGYAGQIVHGIIAWMEIPEYKDEEINYE